MTCAIVIPARMASTRFPGKPLCDLAGKPMIQWVYEAAVASNVANEVAIATPDAEIAEAAKSFGARTILTGANHPSGTDRIAEAAREIGADVYLNVQGDEPLISLKTIQSCVEPLLNDSQIEMGSAWAECPDHDLQNPAAVKVVTDLAGFALYFSRHAIPFPREERRDKVKKHIGIYAYRHDVLQAFAHWPQTPLEAAESLEQLRFLEHGVRIKMSQGEESAVAVDTPEQAEQARQLLASGWSPG